MIVVAAAALWLVLDTMQVFAKITELLTQIGSPELLGLMEYVRFDRVVRWPPSWPSWTWCC
jgi:hypothetical protein